MTGNVGRRPADARAEPHFDEEGFIAAYQERFVEFHLAWSIFFVGHLSALRSRFGDLEDALLLAALGLGPAAGKMKDFQATQDPRSLSYGAAVGEATVTNSIRLAELTGIPRQTVRRKLKAFAQRGWVEQTADRSWRLARRPDMSASITADMAAENQDFLRQLAQLLGRFDRLRRSPPAQVARIAAHAGVGTTPVPGVSLQRDTS
jgi:hypothetical protein